MKQTGIIAMATATTLAATLPAVNAASAAWWLSRTCLARAFSVAFSLLSHVVYLVCTSVTAFDSLWRRSVASESYRRGRRRGGDGDGDGEESKEKKRRRSSRCVYGTLVLASDCVCWQTNNPH